MKEKLPSEKDFLTQKGKKSLERVRSTNRTKAPASNCMFSNRDLCWQLSAYMGTGRSITVLLKSKKYIVQYLNLGNTAEKAYRYTRPFVFSSIL